jgi:tRNA(Ile)-lysidine synthase
MYSYFIQHVHQRQLFTSKQRILLAVSGGVDSSVLAHLLKKGDFNFELAHCNFMLRGVDSNKDELFCRELSKRLGVSIHSKKFNVGDYAAKHKLSTQIAARDLRYNWFEELLNTKGFECLLTAHHANDSMETMLINLIRGTGIKGLKGIPERNGRIVRPLLCFTKQEILNFAKEEKIKFRQDKSNSESKYDRNFIRLKVVPLLQQLNPSLEKTFLENMKRFGEESHLIGDYLELKRKELQTEKDGIIHLNREGILASQARLSLLHALLFPFGFNSSQQHDILENISKKGLVGKHFQSKSHVLSIDRIDLIIKAKSEDPAGSMQILALGDFPGKANIHVQRVLKITKSEPHELCINFNRLLFPLEIRAPQRGDRFKPFGMNGFKLVSDFLKEQKLNSFEKEKCRLLVNGNAEIIWVIGMRSDERYKVQNGDTNLVKLICEKGS